ncbi:MAG: glutamate-5-semialdehyde dehydrogenase [Candidatus Omnitrophica bacterium]|nr:glutamate-5-semialdehyde dehydrogenase [Candidatus Omnitrophota bacterium]HOX54196.1 glutamate-5-semialdehyde dehydrogenase [Candidatus Omnitrophota bacterium]
MELKKKIITMARGAQEASRELALVPTELKNKTLVAMAKALAEKKDFILAQNKKDVILAQKKGFSGSLIDRLILNDKRIYEMSRSLMQVASLKDYVGETIRTWKRPNGLIISKVRVPIGVIAIIYEARPNVTSDCIGLCLKSSNSVILKGGSEALNSNIAIYKVLKDVAEKFKLPRNAINLIDTSDRKAVDILLGLNNYIDLVIPRGGESLIRSVAAKSKIPVVKHYKGICHTYVDKYADIDTALNVSFNAKVQRPAVCNAMETLLVHKDIAKKFLPEMAARFKAAGVELRGDDNTRRIVKGIKKAADKDWATEYLDLILSVRVVDSLDEAIDHINTFGSKHSDAIITENKKNASEFLKKVDSAAVFVNASTRFTDGYEFGLGAEIGISTEKLHARGPMALEELTTYKYTVFGDGQIRQ